MNIGIEESNHVGNLYCFIGPSFFYYYGYYSYGDLYYYAKGDAKGDA